MKRDQLKEIVKKKLQENGDAVAALRDKNLKEVLSPMKLADLLAKEGVIKDEFLDMRGGASSKLGFILDKCIKELEIVKEISSTGGGASFTPGVGEQYATPKAFNGKKKLPIIRKPLR